MSPILFCYHMITVVNIDGIAVDVEPSGEQHILASYRQQLIGSLAKCCLTWRYDEVFHWSPSAERGNWTHWHLLELTERLQRPVRGYEHRKWEFVFQLHRYKEMGSLWKVHFFSFFFLSWLSLLKKYSHWFWLFIQIAFCGWNVPLSKRVIMSSVFC